MIPKHIEREGGNANGDVTTTYIWEDGLTFSFDRDQNYGVDADLAFAFIYHDWHEWQLDSDGSFTFRRFGREEDRGEFVPVPQPWHGNPVYRFLKILEAEYLATLGPFFALQQRLSGNDYELHRELFATRKLAELQALKYLNAVLSWQNIEGLEPFESFEDAVCYAFENDIAYVEITALTL